MGASMLKLEKLPVERAYILQNLYPCYLHDLSEYQDILPNQHGLFESEDITTYEKETFLKIWWQHPGLLSPFLISVEGRPAGFVLLAKKPFSNDSDNEIVEFFILKPYRKKGWGGQAAIQALDLFHGNWRIRVLFKNLPALAFWRSIIAKYTASKYLESNDRSGENEIVVFRFSN
jgi:predicted acetyltransferase